MPDFDLHFHDMHMDDSATSPIRIAYTINHAFVPFAMVSVCSVIDHQTRPCEFHFVHDGDLDLSLQRNIRRFAESISSKTTVDFHRVPDSFPRQFEKETSWDISVLFRLALADILPSEIDRVIYLDGDTLIRGPLDELMDIKLGETGLGAIAEPHSATRRLDLPPDACYLNSGVLAIDLKTWRERQTSQRMIARIMETPDRWQFPDQDILAVQFEGKWRRIPPEYNVTHRFFNGDALPLPTEHPTLIHFTGQGEKPWHSDRPHPFADEFWSVAENVRDAGFDVPPRPKRSRKWYHHGPVGWYRNRRQERKAVRRENLLASQRHRRDFYRKRDRDITRQFASDLTVRRGPFAGLRYPQAYSHGSTLAAKMLGTYEAELQPTIERLLQRDYSTIIDVGGAEGYYAIGAARVWPNATVIAYELQREARAAIDEMARFNGVRERVEIHAECLFGDLYGRRGLIICDIEGCEADLLVHPDAAIGFQGCDFLIETHDLFRPGICSELREQFSKTHDVTVIQSVPDDERPALWALPELAGLSPQRQSQVLAERRGGPMQWLICESKETFPKRLLFPTRAA
ncbi:MAG: glycosyltransferase [Planctomycetota bacterium]